MTDSLRRKLLMMTGPTAAIGLLVAFLLGWSILSSPNLKAQGYIIVSVVTVVLVTVELVLGVGKLSVEKLRLCIPPILLVASTAVWLSLVETTPGKIAVFLIGVLLVSSYQSHLLPTRKRSEDNKNLTESGPEMIQSEEKVGFLNSRPGLPQAAVITDLLTVFFFTSFLFGLGGFYDISMFTTAVVVGVLWGVLAHENFWRFGFNLSDQRILGSIFGLIGAEISLGLSILPIAYLTRSAIVALLFAFGLHLTRQIVMGTIENHHFRRDIGVIIALIILLLITTKWT